MEYLFVYGTLRSELAPPHLRQILNESSRIGTGTVRGQLYDLGQYPGAKLDPLAESLIVGEVFTLLESQPMLAVLDYYEGFDPADPEASLFIRTRCQVELNDHRQLECWIYVYNQSLASAPLITSGDYLKRGNLI
jgi:gamma-glutamylcyclotransferase (GGCT)/AIG2-like uncharacterized protein YtfP